MREVPLSQGLVAIVDDEDYDLVSDIVWCAEKQCRTVYAKSNTRVDGKPASLYMHRLLLGLPAGSGTGVEVDHRNGDGLDNRRHNIRVVTRRQNMQNRTRKRRGTSSRFKGVSWDKRDQKWAAEIRIDSGEGRSRKVFLGRFIQEEDAAKAYDSAARRYFGEYAAPNFEETL